MRQMLHFPPFRLDLSDEQLWRADHPIKLRPKTYRVLAHLVARAPSLVTQGELHSAVWGDSAVTPGTLTQSITELRRALDDHARQPRFIETAHRRGYRFIATVSSSATGESSRPAATPLALREGNLLVGRESELEQLEAALQSAKAGRRQLVFVTGEPGIGKTSLVRSFLQTLAGHEDGLRIAWGHCVELHGESEAYLPVLNALDRLAREGDSALRDALARFAPSWLVQLPWLAAGGPEALAPLTPGHVTPTRMLRELCVTIEEFTRERALVLWLEDLHWSDNATVDLLGALAHREDPARLLVLATYRPVDAAVAGHPVASLKRSLLQRGECQELDLPLLDESGVATYLRGRFAWKQEPVELGLRVHLQSEGNPLFMVTLATGIAAKAGAAQAGAAPLLEEVGEFSHLLGTETLREVVEDQIVQNQDSRVSAQQR